MVKGTATGLAAKEQVDRSTRLWNEPPPFAKKRAWDTNNQTGSFRKSPNTSCPKVRRDPGRLRREILHDSNVQGKPILHRYRHEV